MVRSEAQDITITRSSDVESLESFERIHSNLMTEKGFRVNQDVRFFINVQERASGNEKLVVHMAWKDGHPVAGHVGCIMGDTANYLFGASTQSGRTARASFRLQWEFMRFARSIRVAWYDLGGVDPDENSTVFRFKKRMNGTELSWAGHYDYSRSGVILAILHATERCNTRNGSIFVGRTAGES